MLGCFFFSELLRRRLFHLWLGELPVAGSRVMALGNVFSACERAGSVLWPVCHKTLKNFRRRN